MIVLPGLIYLLIGALMFMALDGAYTVSRIAKTWPQAIAGTVLMIVRWPWAMRHWIMAKRAQGRRR